MIFLQETALCQSLLSLNCALLLPDIRYTGEMSSNSDWYKNYGAHLGRFESSLGAQDLMQMLKVLKDDPRFLPGRTVVIGFGNAAIPALLASILDGDVAASAGTDVGQTYGEGRTRPYFNGVITIGDLPHIALLMAGRPFLWRGVSDAGKYALVEQFAGLLDSPLELSAESDTLGRAEILAWYGGLFEPPLPGEGKALSIGDATAAQGAAFSLSVYLDGARDETQFGFSVNFDPGRLRFVGADSTGTLTEDWEEVSSQPVAAGVARIEATAGAGTPATGESALLNLLFTVEAAAPLGDSQVEPDAATFSGGIAGATGVAGTVHVLPAPTPTPTFTPTPTPTRTPLPLSSYDLNQNGSIEGGDLLLLIENYGTSGPLGDFNGDGRVDETDLLWRSRCNGETVSSH
ncbi:hypothetical protein HS125_09315 [bacterium]|nr:hypothetical protein [bacterium]